MKNNSETRYVDKRSLIVSIIGILVGVIVDIISIAKYYTVFFVGTAILGMVVGTTILCFSVFGLLSSFVEEDIDSEEE